jgi:hypothetical protein
MVKTARVEAATAVAPAPLESPSESFKAQSPKNKAESPKLKKSYTLASWRKQRTSVVSCDTQEYTIPLPDATPSEIIVRFNQGSHTLTWDCELRRHGQVLLPAASCSLYVFPQIKAENGDPTIPSAAGVQLLQDMILWLAAEASALDAFDAVGAHPTHALMVANTEDSLSLAMAIYERVPEMLTRVHAAAPRPFEGESALHIAAVNRREPQLIRMVELAAGNLSTEQCIALFRSQTVGAFFSKRPMRTYGGTALAYACCFGMRHAVKAMLRTGHVSLNNRADCCKLSGQMPLHAVVSNRQAAMVRTAPRVTALSRAYAVA